TWGGTLSEKEYLEFSLPYMHRVVAGIRRERSGVRVPNILFTKGGGAWLEAMAATGCDALGVDWTQDLGEARARVGDRVALQGNLDREVLRKGPQAVKDGVAAVLKSFGRGPGHVFNLGHSVTQHTPPENVAALVDAVHGASKAYH